MPSLLVIIVVTIICHCSVQRSWNKPDFALGDYVRQRHVVVLSPPGNESAAPVYVGLVSFTTVDITSVFEINICLINTRQVTRATHVRNRVCPRVELILKIIIRLLIRFLGLIKNKPC